MKRIDLKVERYGDMHMAWVNLRGHQFFMATGHSKREAVEDVCAVFRNWMWDRRDRNASENEAYND